MFVVPKNLSTKKITNKSIISLFDRRQIKEISSNIIADADRLATKTRKCKIFKVKLDVDARKYCTQSECNTFSGPQLELMKQYFES